NGRGAAGGRSRAAGVFGDVRPFLLQAPTSTVLRLRAILNVYPPNTSTAATNSNRIAASHRWGVLRSSGFPKITITVIAKGTRKTIPSTTQMNFFSDACSENGIERS